MLIPSSTYRIQFNPKFTFQHLSEICDYLCQLGITSIYASPILQPTKGSEHGYDGVNPSTLNPELGTREDMEALSKKLKEKNIGWIQDIVPNHLAFNTSNVWLKDVLERGINSSYATHFDIDWQHPDYTNKLMTPFLEADTDDCVMQGKLVLNFHPEKGFYLSYYEEQYPVKPESYPFLLSGCFDADNSPVNAALSALISNLQTDYEHWQQLKSRLLETLAESASREAIEEKVNAVNSDKNNLLTLIREQHYSLCHFAESHSRINYRRFFNVNGLICLRMEEEKVFDDYHRYIHELFQNGLIQGLRIDHIDGLKNPPAYIRRLRKLFGDDCYVIVEKILDAKEELPATMQIEGTSGYEFLSYINQVITDRQGAETLLALYNEQIPEFKDYEEIVFQNKLANLQMYLNGEWDNLLRLMLSLDLVDDEEISIADLKMALGVFMTAFPVYRVYIEALPLEINDEQLVVAAFVRAFKQYPDLNYPLGIIRQMFEPHPDPNRNANRLIFIQRLMQFTGPLAAKGIEDTTFYQYNALISHNEVGDQPCVLGIPIREFHEKMIERQQKNFLSLNCTSTHDTKRGEDNRVRINIISELTDEWVALVREWQQINEPFRVQLGDRLAPVPNDEYFLYQAILGGFPEDMKMSQDFVERTKRYFTKVMREAKHMSDHVNPNTDYEKVCTDFIEHLLNEDHAFLPSLRPFVKKIIGYANTYTMVQVIIKCTAPGIPDIYQGCELWDLSYVDPDNRRPVNFELRRELLNTIEAKSGDTMALLEWANEHFETGIQKLLVTTRLLHLRKKNPTLFTRGEYIPVYSEGSDRIVIAYLRHFENDWALVVLPLGVVAHTGKELQLMLPPEAPKNWKNIFTGESAIGDILQVHELFRTFPVAVLIPD